MRLIFLFSLRSAEVRLQKHPLARSRFQGIKSLRSVRESLEEDGEDAKRWDRGYVGTVADLLETRFGSELNTALSEELGTRMFSIVVRDAATVTWMLSLVNAMGLPGEFVFMPADTLLIKEPQHFDPATMPNKCKMMMELLEPNDDPAVDKAMR